MFNVTSAARSRLWEKLVNRAADTGMALRFTRRAGGWTLKLDRAGPADQTFDYEGKPVLLLDPSASTALAERTLDAKRTQGGARLTLK